MRYHRSEFFDHPVRLALLLAFALTWGATGAQAVDRNWANPVTGSASTSSLWSPSGAPGAADRAFFPDQGAFTVTWTSPQDTLSYLYSIFGTPAHSISSVLGVRNIFSISQTGQATISKGILRANQVIVAGTGGGKLFIPGGLASSGTVVSRSPNAAMMFAETTSTTARVYIMSGGQLLSNSWIEAARYGASSCSVVVDGYRYLLGSYYRSTLGTLTNSGGGNRGDIIIGAGGSLVTHAYLDVTNGAVLDAKGSLYAGRSGFGIVKMYETIANTNPRMYVLGNTLVGIDPTSGHSGTGDLFIRAGTALLGGNLQIGDPDHTIGTAGFGTVYVSGGNTVIGGAIQMPAALSGILYHTGGTIRTLSGVSEIRQSEPLNVSSNVGGSPLFVVNGTAQVRPYPGSSTPVALGVGRGGVGRVRVCGFSARLDAQGMIVVADSLGGSGIFEADSGGIVSSADTLRIGAGGQLFVGEGSIVSSSGGLANRPFESSGVVTMNHGSIISPIGSFRSPGTFSGNGLLYGGFVNESGFSVPSDTLEIVGELDNRGTISGGGTIRVDSGHLQTSGVVDVSVYLTNAQLQPHDPPAAFVMPSDPSGLGRVGGLRATSRGPRFDDSLDPPLGHLQLQGNLAMTHGAGSIAVRIGSAASGLRDTLEVGGSATLTGILVLESLVDSPPVPGDTITVLEAGSMSGAFTSVTLDGQDPGADLQVLYDATSVRVVFVPAATAVGDDPAAPHAPAEIRFSASDSRGMAALVLELPLAARVRIEVFDVMGREVACLADEPMAIGRHEFRLPRVASGMYFARARVDTPNRSVVKVSRVALRR